MRVIYLNGIPVSDGYAGYIERYFSPRERALAERNVEDVEYEDLTEEEQ